MYLYGTEIWLMSPPRRITASHCCGQSMCTAGPLEHSRGHASGSCPMDALWISSLLLHRPSLGLSTSIIVGQWWSSTQGASAETTLMTRQDGETAAQDIERQCNMYQPAGAKRERTTEATRATRGQDGGATGYNDRGDATCNNQPT
jgi:hypothetical protein